MKSIKIHHNYLYNYFEITNFRFVFIVLFLIQTCSAYFGFFESIALSLGIIEKNELQLNTYDENGMIQEMELKTGVSDVETLQKETPFVLHSPKDHTASRAQKMNKVETCENNENYLLICIGVESALLVIFILLYCNERFKKRQPLKDIETS